MNTEIQQRILELQRNGMSLRAIAEEVQVSRMTVKRLLDRFKVEKVVAKRDWFEPVERKVRQIELELKTLNLAYDNKQITLEELIKAEDRLGKHYCRFIDSIERNISYNVHKREVPISDETKLSIHDEEGLVRYVLTKKL